MVRYYLSTQAHMDDIGISYIILQTLRYACKYTKKTDTIKNNILFYKPQFAFNPLMENQMNCFVLKFRMISITNSKQKH